MGWGAAARTFRDKYRVLRALFLTAAQQAPPLTLLTAAVVAGVVIGVFGHLVRSRPLILFGIVVVGAVCGHVVVASYLGAFYS